MHSKGSSREPVPRLFGTNGVRGVVNSRQMDCRFAMRLGTAIGSYMRGTVMIATDARTSNEMLRSACASGIMSTGCDVLDLGIVPTPTLQYAVKTHMVAGGVMITASHNPPEFNGIKCIDPDGTEMARENEEIIERLHHEEDFTRADWHRVGTMKPFTTSVEEYLQGILSKTDVPAVRKAGLKVALDCGNGAASFVAPRLLELLGVKYISLNANPDGHFPGHNSEPTPENTRDLVELIKKGGFDLGVVLDGDADRSIFIDETGRYLYGDRSLAIVAYHKCLEAEGGLVVTSIGSSTCVEDAARMARGSLQYTKVGSPTIARVMIERGGVFGGEENGGLIFPELQYCRDGSMAVAKMLEIVAKNGKLSKLNDMIPTYHQSKVKTSCPDGRKQQVMEVLEREAKAARIDRTDGLKLFLEDGWVLARPSGTEPIFRVFTEARTAERAEQLAREYKERVERIVRA